MPFQAWNDTRETLHRWLQIVGKVRLAFTPWVNHSWHATLYPTARGLTTSLIPHGLRVFQIDLDFIRHALVIATGEGELRETRLAPRSVADLFRAVCAALRDLGIAPHFWAAPNELDDATPFRDDEVHRAYDPEVARRYWEALVQVTRVFEQFRTEYVGKVSPVHLFWGGFDLALTRFSGRPAPPHPGGVPHLPDEVAREAYSHEVSSAGFWPGTEELGGPAFYAYAYPEPAGFANARVEPAETRYDPSMGEFVLPYARVRAARDPDATLLAFLRTTYAAAADLGRWDRKALECAPGRPAIPRPI